MCGIYKITNNINKKIYIGKSVNIETRWNQHKYTKDSLPIHHAIQKYGINNFTFEVIEECNPKDLNEKEIYWIKHFNSYSGEGYNLTQGGDGASHPVLLSNNEVIEIIELLKDNKQTIKQIAELYNVSLRTISDINNGKSRILTNIEYPIRPKPFNVTNISKQELINLLIKTHGDFNYISQLYGINYVTVKNLCKKYELSTKREDYNWKDTQEYHSKSIIRCNKETQEPIEEYYSIREAGRQLGINHNSIRKALKSKTHISSGYYWKEK